MIFKKFEFFIKPPTFVYLQLSLLTVVLSLLLCVFAFMFNNCDSETVSLLYCVCTELYEITSSKDKYFIYYYQLSD